MNYALCNNCGHWEDFMKSKPGNFVVFAEGVDISGMTIADMDLAGVKDLKIECQKCGGSDVQVMDYPPSGSKRQDTDKQTI